MTLLFILISWGWTINFNPLSKFEYFGQITGAVIVFHIILVLYERFTENTLDNKHLYDSIAGTIIALIRVGLYVYFIKGIYETICRTKKYAV